MTSLAWPLERNHIRGGILNNAFGMVRNGGSRAHQGWDLYAPPGTPCYAIADGKIVDVRFSGDYGNTILLEFLYGGRTLYAAYSHLSMIVKHGGIVSRGEMIGLTGNTGNARAMRGEEQHLHFEIRSALEVGAGLGGRIDPGQLYGRAPIGWTFYESHGQGLSLSGTGLKLRGVNVREERE